MHGTEKVVVNAAWSDKCMYNAIVASISNENICGYDDVLDYHQKESKVELDLIVSNRV